ncbi:homoserine dehydrogenase [Bacillus thuringiensis]|uniref:Homoserine dehydrogenase n=2 Tax=Bacillaceae TaxID=186817 RepID=A0A242WG84_BACTU|nr:homoserine dehydrogenase [Bacillus thuringiensis]KAA0748859.1 homoserine dehydrogenase [Bacillus sp. AY1-10]OTW54232.1 homoserine dehydrogenase [Bacillus thuringiensis serovar mexicanensis]OTW96084.1 homoserine dehydrogenase [Bacillus thuringiensis serovar monterrey]OUA97641.1 homoserine dehydrogenase [Bacillus thuringiensis serovar oswaldocruzi]PGB50792.1 homoserine dehydrogenase [Bacillus anthracis]TBX89120.1 homoserine dehydrogenase [Bacillus cereus]TEA45140.1 homoserine dehydrogenase 
MKMIEFKSIIHSYKLKRKIAKDLYGKRDELTMLLNELNNIKCTVTSEKKKKNLLSHLQLIYQNMKLDKQYPLPIAFNNILLERLEKESIHTIEDGVTCLHFMLDMNYEKIKQYGSSTSRSFVPLSQSSICLADCICLTGVVLGLLGSISFGGLMLSICSII